MHQSLRRIREALSKFSIWTVCPFVPQIAQPNRFDCSAICAFAYATPLVTKALRDLFTRQSGSLIPRFLHWIVCHCFSLG